jgi:hypothetical protein
MSTATGRQEAGRNAGREVGQQVGRTTVAVGEATRVDPEARRQNGEGDDGQEHEEKSHASRVYRKWSCFR